MRFSFPEKKVIEASKPLPGKSLAFSPLAFAQVLKATEEELGPDLDWHFTESGERFEPIFNAFYPQLEKEGLKAITSQKVSVGTVEPVNRFLKKKGFSIKLKPLRDPQGIACAAVVDIVTMWQTEGEKQSLTLDTSKKVVPGIKLEQVQFFTDSTKEKIIVELETKSAIRVFVTPDNSKGFEDEFELFEQVTALTAEKEIFERVRFKGVAFPMVDLSHDKDPTWLLKTTVTSNNGDGLFISQAKSQHILRLNEKGARAKAAVAIALARSLPLPPFTINSPYLIWFELDGMVLFCARVDEDVMREPTSL
ncbi:MAG: hypothetical protein AB8F95_05035 [Bacteroidia bacterium]